MISASHVKSDDQVILLLSFNFIISSLSNSNTIEFNQSFSMKPSVSNIQFFIIGQTTTASIIQLLREIDPRTASVDN